MDPGCSLHGSAQLCFSSIKQHRILDGGGEALRDRGSTKSRVHPSYNGGDFPHHRSLDLRWCCFDGSRRIHLFLWFIKAREYLWELVEEVTGARLTTNWTRFGGNATDIPDGFFDALQERLDKVKDIMDECDKLLTRNKIFIDRVKDVGTFSKEDAISFGFTGPMLRACGVPYDVRRADPYSVYDEIDFEIPIGSTGDCFDRYLVRMEEIRQSISIIEQAADMMPAGPIMTDERLMHYPDKKEVYGNIEGLIDHFKLVMEGHQPPVGEVYLPTEGGNGEIGFYLVSDGSGDPVRVRMRPACFNYVEAMPAMTVGHYVADIVPIFGSVNMIGGELDR